MYLNALYLSIEERRNRLKNQATLVWEDYPYLAGSLDCVIFLYILQDKNLYSRTHKDSITLIKTFKCNVYTFQYYLWKYSSFSLSVSFLGFKTCCGAIEKLWFLIFSKCIGKYSKFIMRVFFGIWYIFTIYLFNITFIF